MDISVLHFCEVLNLLVMPALFTTTAAAAAIIDMTVLYSIALQESSGFKGNKIFGDLKWSSISNEELVAT